MVIETFIQIVAHWSIWGLILFVITQKIIPGGSIFRWVCFIAGPALWVFMAIALAARKFDIKL